MPLATGKEEESNIYYKADLRKNKTLDERKLLETGFYNKTVLTTLNKSGQTVETVTSESNSETSRTTDNSRLSS